MKVQILAFPAAHHVSRISSRTGVENDDLFLYAVTNSNNRASWSVWYRFRFEEKEICKKHYKKESCRHHVTTDCLIKTKIRSCEKIFENNPSEINFLKHFSKLRDEKYFDAHRINNKKRMAGVNKFKEEKCRILF